MADGVGSGLADGEALADGLGLTTLEGEADAEALALALGLSLGATVMRSCQSVPVQR